MLLGTVGAFNWSGGVLLYNTQNGRGRFLNQTAKEDFGAAQYSYLGKGRVWWMQVGQGWRWQREKGSRIAGGWGEGGAWMGR